MIRRFQTTLIHRGKIKKVTLLFFLGFFVGVILYYFFQHSFHETLVRLDGQIQQTLMETLPFGESLLFIIVESSKGFLLLWILSRTKFVDVYMIGFIVYKGLGYGFLTGFFVMERGIRGLIFALAYLFPQTFFFVPAYLLSMAKIKYSEQDKVLPAVVVLYLILLIGCLVEAKFNIPLMSSLYATD